MYPWFTWTYKPIVVTAIAFIIALLHAIFQNKQYTFKYKHLLPIFFFFLIISWESLNSNLFGKINYGLNFIIISLIICLKDNSKIELLNYITKWFAILLLISLSCYILFLFQAPLPHTALSYKESLHENYIFDNYYTFIVPAIRFISYTRFQGVFLEPGHLTMGLVILLFANKYDIKNKYVLILILAQIFALSLAGYVLMCIGFSFFILSSASINRKIIQKTIFVTIIFIGGVFIVNHLFSDNVIDTAILERLEYSNGTIAGNNRTSSYFDNIYNQVINSPDKWTGVEWDHNAYGGNSGFKKYVVTNGIIGVLLVILFYTSIIFNIKSRTMIGLSLVLFLLLYQNAYPTWWCVCLSVIIGIPNLKNDKNLP